jgi:phosphoribosylaminoimidazole-succinocarboxamide synthase
VNSTQLPYLGARREPDPGLAHLPFIAAGKVRDLYTLDDRHLLFVTSDRISAFDVVFDEGVPHKGRVLTAIAAFWFARTSHLVPNHLVTTDVDAVPSLDAATRARLAGRIMIVRRARPTPIEWVVRGYLAGSGFKQYRDTGALWGQPLPRGLRLGDRLPEPVLTPTTKADEHDEPLDLGAAEGLVGRTVFKRAREAAFALFAYGGEVLAEHAILLADTKFEFGLDERGDVVLIDEVLTPDSSRMWPRATWSPGADQPSYDKQILRDWLERQPWNKQPPAPRIDPGVLARLSQRYVDLCVELTGALPIGGRS